MYLYKDVCGADTRSELCIYIKVYVEQRVGLSYVSI